MPSTPSTRLRVELQALGENLSTWGDTRLNEALKRLEEGQAKVTSKALSGNVTLTSQNYVEDEARAFVLVLTGTPGATFKVTIPGVQKPYLVANLTANDQTIGTSGGLSAAVRAGQTTMVYCDGADTFAMDPTLDRVKAPTAAVSFNNKKATNLAAGTVPTDGVNYQQWLDLKAYAQGLSNSGILAPGTVLGSFLRWGGDPNTGGTGWAEASIPPLVAGFGTSVTGSFNTNNMAVNVVAGTSANQIVGRDTSARIPVMVAPWQDKTATYTAVNGDQIRGNTTGGAFTVNLPASPVVDDAVVVSRIGASALTIGRNGSTIAGLAEDHILDSNYALVTFVCTGTNAWRAIPGQFR